MKQLLQFGELAFSIIPRKRDPKWSGQLVTLSRHSQGGPVYFQQVLASAQAFGSQNRENNTKISTQNLEKQQLDEIEKE